MTNANRDGLEIDLPKLLLSYLHKWRLIAVCTIVGAAAALLITNHFITPMYKASVTIYVNNARSDAQVEYITSTDLSTSQRLVNTYINIIKSDTVLEKVALESGLDLSAAQIRDAMSALQKDDTEMFDVTITSADPELAAFLANAIADVAPGEIEGFVEGSSTKIIDYAKVPATPSSPSVTRNSVLGALVGCAGAVLYLTLLFLMDVRIQDEEDLTRLFARPVLAQIPAFPPEGSRRREGYGNHGYVYSQEPGDLLAPERDFFLREAYKTLRTNVSFAMTSEGAGKVIVVTSAQQGEGKSITALNLAISYAMTDRKVLVVDCDLRHPRLARLLRLNAAVGLSELILDPAVKEQAILRTEPQGLDVLLSGRIPPNPSELLGSSRMQRLLEELRESYDYILLDAPPVNMVTDAVVLAPQSDGVLFLVRANHAERGAIIHAVEQLEYAKAKLLGFVLNDVDMKKTYYSCRCAPKVGAQGQMERNVG